MKRLIIIFLTCWLSLSAEAQTWSRHSVGNGISAQFPSEPTYQVKNQQGKNVETYLCKSENCIFMAMVFFQAIPQYTEFVKLKQNDQIKLIGQYLDNYIQGKLSYTNADAKAKTINVGRYQGREVDYKAVNPASGQIGKRYTKAIIVNDRLISFECWFLSETSTANAQKAKFFTSITTK